MSIQDRINVFRGVHDALPLESSWMKKGVGGYRYSRITPGFGSDFVEQTEQNRRRSSSYVEDFLIEERRNMAQRRDARWDLVYSPSPLGPYRLAVRWPVFA